jgi:hypothetical protein
MRAVIAVLTFALLSSSAFAQHKHGAKGPNGGPMEDVAGVHAELTTAGNTISFYVFDDNNRPLKTSGYSGSVLIASGGERETVQLAASGEHALKGEARRPVAKGASVTLMLKTDQGKTGQARFAP